MDASYDLQPGWRAALPALLAGYRSGRHPAVTAEFFRMASCADADIRAARILAGVNAGNPAARAPAEVLVLLHDALHELDGVALYSPLPLHDAPASDKLAMLRPVVATIDDLETT